jgi:hypothetical protein
MSNSQLLNSGQIGNIGLNHMKAIRQQTQQNSGIDAEAELTAMLSEQLAGEIDSEFKAKQGIMTRYGNKPVNEKFYGNIRIGGIQNNKRRLLIGL